MRKIMLMLLLAGLLLPTACGEDKDKTNANGSEIRSSGGERRSESERRAPAPRRPDRPRVTTHRPPAPEPERPAAPVVPAVHVVRGGETLTAIARRYTGKDWRYQELQKVNNIRDPRKIRPGQQLKIPASWRTAPARTTTPPTTTPTTTGGTSTRTTASLNQQPEVSTAPLLRVVARSTRGKTYFERPTSRALEEVARSVADGREKWRANGMQVAQVTLQTLGAGKVSVAGLWRIPSRDGSRSLFIHRQEKTLYMVELEKSKQGIWFAIASDRSAIPTGYAAKDVDARNGGLATVLKKRNVGWK